MPRYDLALPFFLFVVDRGRVITGSYGSRHMMEVRERIESGATSEPRTRRKIPEGAGV